MLEIEEDSIDKKIADLEAKYDQLLKILETIQIDVGSVKNLMIKEGSMKKFVNKPTLSGKQVQLIEFLLNKNGTAKMKELTKNKGGAGMVESTASLTVKALVDRNIIEKIPDIKDPKSRYMIKLNKQQLLDSYDVLPTYIQKILSDDNEEK
ncbi:MAG: hypothetical protein ACFFAU_17250 [Candidatus Hodarchaeota archaeon]